MATHMPDETVEPTGQPPVVAVTATTIARAVAVLRAGGLVAVPTETVYGLGADASNPAAVERVFAAKGRPASHPLIVHLHDAAHLPTWAAAIPDDAWRLADAFWPGPLTMILPRHPLVPLAVTGGRDTVAVRVPSHPVAQQLLQAFDGGIAAPSANRFGRVSPTTAAAVVAELGDRVDLVLDGGPCAIGLESTIVEFGSDDAVERNPAAVTVLRPGGVSAAIIENVLGAPVNVTVSGPARAPGMLASHYAPHTPVVICEPEQFSHEHARHAATGARIGVIALEPVAFDDSTPTWDAAGNSDRYAHALYGWLRDADTYNLDVLIAVLPPPIGVGVAIRDRLTRAAQR